MAELSLSDKAKNLLDYANENRKSGLFNDINIQVGNERFPCNKMVLSCYSTYFQTMFRTEMQERYQDTIELQEIDGKYIKMMINYMYGETIVINDEHVVEVLAAADYVQLQDVKDFCIEYLKARLSSTNCLDALAAYRLYMSDLSPDHVYLFISKNFNAVFHQEKFKNVATNDFATLIENLSKTKDVNQESLFLAIISWVEHNEETRKDQFPLLFDSLDLSQISSAFLDNVVSNCPLVEQNVKCLKLVVKALANKLKKTEMNQNLFPKEKEKILCLGGIDRSSVIEVYNIFGKAESAYPNLPATLSWHCVETVDSLVYCLGGKSGAEKKAISDLYRIDLNIQGSKWTELASMSETRCYHATAVFQGNIIVSGGGSAAAERYEIEANNWMAMQAMQGRQSGHALVVCKNFLYAFGGLSSDGSAKSTSSVERLHDVCAKWHNVQPMNTPRNRLAAVCLDEAIYAIGGRSNEVEKSVEKFLPIENKWSYVSAMNSARWGHASCVMGGKIYVIGGKDNRGNFVTTIECYNPNIDSWSIVGDKHWDLEGHAVVAM